MVEAGSIGEKQPSPEIKEIQKQIIVICGPEGSGKTTQAKLLAEKLSLPRVAMGDVFRELSRQDTDLGRKSRELFEQHKYSDIELWREAFLWRAKNREKEDLKNGFILDGGFRFKDEVDYFEEILKEASLIMPIKVGYLRIAAWRGYERLKGRGRGADDTDEGIVKRHAEHYGGLGERMTVVSKKWPFFIISVNDKTKEEVSNVIMKKIKGGEDA